MIRPFRGVFPVIADAAYVEASAQIIGDVHLGKQSSVWFNAVIRGDMNYIRIGESTNIQDGSVLHVNQDDSPLIIGHRVTMGHNVIAHGCSIRDGALIGMGAIVLDGAVIGEQAFVAAGAVVGMNQEVPPRMLVAGIPARVKRPLGPEDLAMMDAGWRHYVDLVREYREGVPEPGKT
ncbi:MAG: gamma carbonic anhydrase family protein [Acidobacteria bacterium]|nr:gamma carbonic anhydrase family protein [Acidobacteriota bacterium]